MQIISIPVQNAGSAASPKPDPMGDTAGGSKGNSFASALAALFADTTDEPETAAPREVEGGEAGDESGPGEQLRSEEPVDELRDGTQPWVAEGDDAQRQQVRMPDADRAGADQGVGFEPPVEEADRLQTQERQHVNAASQPATAAPGGVGQESSAPGADQNGAVHHDSREAKRDVGNSPRRSMTQAEMSLAQSERPAVTSDRPVDRVAEIASNAAPAVRPDDRPFGSGGPTASPVEPARSGRQSDPALEPRATIAGGEQGAAASLQAVGPRAPGAGSHPEQAERTPSEARIEPASIAEAQVRASAPRSVSFAPEVAVTTPIATGGTAPVPAAEVLAAEAISPFGESAEAGVLRSSPATATANPVVADLTTARPETVRNAAAHAVEVLTREPGKTVEIALNPEELGRVRMALSPSDAGVTVLITSERPETLELMRRHIEQLSQEFQKLGYEQAHFEFSGETSDGEDRPAHERPAGYGTAGTPDETQNAIPTRLVQTGLDLRL